jgi:hypothetical protein
MLRTGVMNEVDLNKAEASRFDQLPVIDVDDAFCGLIATTEARKLYDAGRELERSDPAIHLHQINAQLLLTDLLTTLADNRAVVIQEHGNGSNHRAHWFAIVTISDLNRHHFRAELYPVITEFEAAAAELIDRWFVDPWAWLSKISEDKLVSILGRWELQKRKGVDISPINGCMLTDLVNVIGSFEEIRAKLGFTSGSKFKDATGTFAELRNKIMHPVRPLVLSLEDIKRLRGTIVHIVQLTQRVHDVIRTLDINQTLSPRYLP